MRHMIHLVLLFLEIAIFLVVLLRALFVGDENAMLLHYHLVSAYVLTVLGLSSLLMFFIATFGLSRSENADRRSRGARILSCGLAMVSVVCIALAGRMVCAEYPEFFRWGKPSTGHERIAVLGGVAVHLDANGGRCEDSVRIVKSGASYSDNVNVYVIDDERNFAQLTSVRVNLPRNLLVVSSSNKSSNVAYAHYFASNAVPLFSKTEKWSYVVDVENLKGCVADWYVGQTWSTNNNVYSHLEESRVGPNDGEWKVRILRLGVNPWSDYNFLDRGVIFVGPGQALDMAFRVSLFAGTGIDKSNYHYVRPGETLACPLPVPTKEGYAFDGWFDGDRLITEESKVEKREAHTLRARWRKL